MRKRIQKRARGGLSLLLAVAMVLATLPAQAIAEQLGTIDQGAASDVAALSDDSNAVVLGGDVPSDIADTEDAASLGETPDAATLSDTTALGGEVSRDAASPDDLVALEADSGEETMLGAQAASFILRVPDEEHGTVLIRMRMSSVESWQTVGTHYSNGGGYQSAKIPSGAQVQLVATPDEGYRLDKYDAHPEVEMATEDGRLTTFTMPERDLDVFPSFAEGEFHVQHSVNVETVCAGILKEHVSITADPATAVQGETVTVTVEKQDFIEFVPYADEAQTPLFYVHSTLDALTQWTDFFCGGNEVDSGSPTTNATKVNETTYTFTMPDENVVVNANITTSPFTLTLADDVPAKTVDVIDSFYNTALIDRNKYDEGRTAAVRAGNMVDIYAMFQDRPGELKRLWYTYEKDGVIKEVVLNKAKGPYDSSDSFMMPIADVTLHAEVEEGLYPLFIQGDPTHGTVECDVVKARKDDVITIRAVPKNPAHYTNIQGRGEDIGVDKVSEGIYEFVMPNHSVAVDISFEEWPLYYVNYREARVVDGRLEWEVNTSFNTSSKGEPTRRMTGGRYILAKDVTFEDVVEVTADTELILRDGYTLTAKDGIYIHKGATLTVYGQVNNSGKIVATTKGEHAAIGGREDAVGGNLIVHGGHIVASASTESAAGIGGGYDDSGFGFIVIYGGTVTATGGYDGAGIGGGEDNATGDLGSLTVWGGTVTATGGDFGAGIGGGNDCDGFETTIRGGTVTAKGGKEAAGIGGGSGGRSGRFAMYGGTVTATGGDYGAGVGGGVNGKNNGFGPTIFGGLNGRVIIRGGDLTAYGGHLGAGIGTGYMRRVQAVAEGIEIHGGNVHAYGGVGAAGIGGGAAFSDSDYNKDGVSHDLNEPVKAPSIGEVLITGGACGPAGDISE